jgi:hypothetical protein
MKIEILQTKLDQIKATLDPRKAQALQEAVEAMNEMVNYIENSNRIKTTQHFYGDYFVLIKTKQDVALYRLAGAGQGVLSAAKICGFID